MDAETLAALLGKAWGTYGQWKANQGRKDLLAEMQQLRAELEELRLHASIQQASDIDAFGNALSSRMPNNLAIGTLVIIRKSQFQGAALRVAVSVDEELKGKLWSGKSMSIPLSAGTHLVEVKCWTVKTRETVIVLPNQQKHIEVAWNTLATKLVLSRSAAL